MGLLTFVFSNHPCVFQGFTLYSFPVLQPSGCSGNKEHTRTRDRLQTPTLHTEPCCSISLVTSKEREINYSKAGSLDVSELLLMIFRYLQCSQPSHLTAKEGWGKENTQLTADEGTCSLLLVGVAHFPID